MWENTKNKDIFAKKLNNNNNSQIQESYYQFATRKF